MDYLVYVSHDAENLQFYLWLQDYTKRFYAAPRPEQVLSPPWFDAEAAAQPSSYIATDGDKPPRTGDKSRVDLAEYEMKYEIAVAAAAAAGGDPPLSPVLSSQGYEKYGGGFDNKSVLSGINSTRTITDSVDDANTQMGLRWQSCKSSYPSKFLSPLFISPLCEQPLKFGLPPPLRQTKNSHNPTVSLRNKSRHITLPRPHLSPRTQYLPPHPLRRPPRTPTHDPPHGLDASQRHGRSRPPRPIPPQLHPLVHLQRQQAASALRPQFRHPPRPRRSHPRDLISLVLRLTMVASPLFPIILCRYRYRHCSI